MRKIKFRAKRLDNREWICGDLHLHSPFPHIHSTRGDKAKINTDTIGQFTGLHDKNGKEIYEGDVIKIYDSVAGCVRYNAKYWRYEVAAPKEPIDNERIPSGKPSECWEIIGNIHDDLELLKTEE